MRLRREVAAIIDMIVRDGIKLRYVPSTVMLADPLTKSMDGSEMLKLGGENHLDINAFHDNGQTTEKDLIEANQVIEMEMLSERLEKIRKEYEAKRVVRGGHQQSREQDDPRQLRQRRKRANRAMNATTSATN